MKYKSILITGGAGFAGSTIARRIRETWPDVAVTCIDNLKRRGSELNLSTLAEHGIDFVHGDIRVAEDLVGVDADLIIDCSAEPSVLAGLDGNPLYVVNSNLAGTVNVLEFARKREADFLFISTSRVYPYGPLDAIPFEEFETRFEWLPGAHHAITPQGVTEAFPLAGARSLYGATKLASELLIEEYRAAFGLNAIIDRFGVLAGPGQFGKVDQGVMVFWLTNHMFDKPLRYIGYEGKGKQVRDFLHIDDAWEALRLQINDFDKYSEGVFNIGGGAEFSFSLQELTSACREVTGNTVPVDASREERLGDVRIYTTDHGRFSESSGWQPTQNLISTLTAIHEWVLSDEKRLRRIFA